MATKDSIENGVESTIEVFFKALSYIIEALCWLLWYVLLQCSKRKRKNLRKLLKKTALGILISIDIVLEKTFVGGKKSNIFSDSSG